MKKLLVLSLLIMSLVMVGCSKTNTPNNEGVPDVEQGNQEDEQKPDDNAPTEGENEGDDLGEETPDQDDVTEEVNTNTEKQEELDNIYNAVKEAYEEYLPNFSYDKTFVKESFGVEEDWYDAYIAEGSMISTHVDTFLAFHPTEGNKENIVKALEAHRDYLINESLQYPMNIAKVNATEIVEEGDYVYLIILGMVDDTIEDDAARIEAFKEQNNIAIEAIKNFSK